MIALKPPTTFEEQLDILISRGLTVGNHDKALDILKRINYYRFTAYTLTFKREDVFFPGTSFETIYRHYEFDAKLRSLLMNIIEHIEISFRTHTAYLIAHKYGPLGYQDACNFRNEDNHNEFIRELNICINRSRDPFVIHHMDNYEGQFPVWVAFEVLTFSLLSKLFSNLKLADQKQIARDYYGNFYQDIPSWLFCLSIIRNRCAHYSRLFNQTYDIKPSIPKHARNSKIKPYTLFAIVYVCKYLITDRDIWSNWVIELNSLIEGYSEVDIKQIGFPEDWVELLHRF